MTQEIEKNEWKKYLDDLSRECLGWQTSVQILNDETGAQILSDGLPFCGLTYEQGKIELSAGVDKENHQTHVIFEPQRVAFEGSGHGPAGMLDIEDASGTKTLINFIQPMPILMEYVETELVVV